jgi:hypothetical protein
MAEYRRQVRVTSPLLLACFVGCASLGDRPPDEGAPADITDLELLQMETWAGCEREASFECVELRRFRQEGKALEWQVVGGRPWLVYNGGWSTAGAPGKFIFIHESKRSGEGPADHRGDVMGFMYFEHDFGDHERREDAVQIRQYVERTSQIPDGNLQVKRARELDFPADAYFPAFRTSGKSTAFIYRGGIGFARMTSWGITIVHLDDRAAGGVLEERMVSLSRATWPWGNTYDVGGDTRTETVRARRTPTLEERVLSCEGGDGEACRKAAEQVLFNPSLPGPQREEKARGLVSRGCDAGSADACDDVAGIGNVNRDWAIHARAQEKACAIRKQAHCPRLGRTLVEFSTTDPERERGERALVDACEAHVEEGCRALAEHVRRTGFAAGRDCLIDACKQGDLKSCSFGAAALQGIDPTNVDQFAPLWARACEGGDNVSCLRLTAYPERAEAKLSDRLTADDVTKLCRDSGSGAACALAAKAFETGTRGAVVDKAKADSLSVAACRLSKLECERACQVDSKIPACAKD